MTSIQSAIGKLTLRQVLGMLYFLGTALLALVILLLVGEQLRAQWREDLLNDGLKVAERLAQDSRLALIQQTAENVQSAVEMARDFPNVEAVAITVSDGTPLVGKVPNHLVPVLQQTMDFTYSSTHLLREDEQNLIIVAPVFVETYQQRDNQFELPSTTVIPTSRQMLGTVMLTVSKASMHQVISTLEQQLLIGIFGLAGIVFVVIMLVMTWITQPFRRLEQVMTDQNTVQCYTQAPVYGVREAREMAGAFNDLMGAFATAQNELVAINAELENRVQQRTKDLQEALEAKSQFLSKMSHEIRTPLHGMIASADLLVATQRVDSAQVPYVQAIHHSAHLLLGVIDSVLDWAKIEAGKLELETTDFDLYGVLQRLDMALSLSAEAKRLALHLDIDPAVPYQLRGDPTRLSQILMNLAGNAVKFTDQGEVRIKVSVVTEVQADATLRFEIIDTGIGIPADVQAHIFDDFVQADESMTRRYGVTGLGTAIARYLVELMGGHIGVESEPGRGSCFWFEITFPIQQGKKLDAPRESQPSLTRETGP
ncbi:MAG: ATP-binding protein, partial [Candidatus Competibacteraceae bacterium]|nr:ATP-binding protein [Candidatus Competibacteraceae bacterium]